MGRESLGFQVDVPHGLFYFSEVFIVMGRC
jgi:hypothetical protein